MNSLAGCCKKDFSTLKVKIYGKRLVYLDSAATSLKPESVIESITDFYRNHNANIHRGVYLLSQEATQLYEKTRSKLKKFFNTPEEGEIIYTSGTTGAVNLVASSWGRTNLGEGDVIVLSEMEHHSNLVPWQIVAREKGAELAYIPVTDSGELDLEEYKRIFKNHSVKIVAVNHISNVLGTLNPVEEIVRQAHMYGALVLIDGAQSAPHIPVDISRMDPDFYTVSGHKMLGPTGTGFLYGRRGILKSMPPYQSGGDMIEEVSLENATWNELPYKFEAGTQNIAGFVGLGAAVDYLSRMGMDRVRKHGEELSVKAREKLSSIKGMKFYGPEKGSPGGVLSFNIEGAHPHDIGTILDSEGIAVRTGHHCAQPLMKRLSVPATARASFYIYNDEQDIESLYSGIHKAVEVLKLGVK
ncbi:MAG: cysteine desulfurase [Spirochaetes bacterium]|nr:cysteine desulfurase [Spirochaetota bacterium]